MERMIARCLLLSAFLFAGITLARASESGAAPVTLAEDASFFTLANDLVTARIEKRTGNLASLEYRGLDLLRGGRGYWSQAAGSSRLGRNLTTAVRNDPAKNGGARAEVSCRFGYDSRPGTMPVDVDIRYVLGRGEHWIYAYAVWEHRAGYPSFSVGEARYALKLDDEVFDFMTIDKDRRRVMPTGEDWDRGTPLNLKEVRRLTTGRHAGQAEHKYGYSAILAETPAYGWSSTKHNVGLWIVNPSMEYIAGGPTKVELTGHLDVNPGGAPTLLNMWLGSHYGGSALQVAQNEAWTKVIGPFLIYCNAARSVRESRAPEPAASPESVPREIHGLTPHAAADHEALWKDALSRAESETQAWPYAWLDDANYPKADARGTVTGSLALRDPLTPAATLSNAWVGLTAPDYPSRGRFRSSTIDWQRDSKFYQHWARTDAQGRFEIKHVRPGSYTLRAISDGVLGEFTRANIVVTAGQPLDLGALTWTPERRGPQLWEIGTPNRSASEFRHGDDFWHWGLYLKYPEEFPNDVNFVIGKSDPRKDWNYCQPPRISPDGSIRDTTWTITFDLAEVPRGPLTLRLAFCGTRAGCRVFVSANGQPVGDTGELPEAGVMHRDGIRGWWFERPITFDAAALKPGTNTIQLRSQADVWHQGVLYDYVRLEAAQ